MSLGSIPRDTLIYCEYSVPKINSAYGWASGGEAGMEQLLMRVGEIIGFQPDGYVLASDMQGSPPPMRGKATTAEVWLWISGITPAYAGKR